MSAEKGATMCRSYHTAEKVRYGECSVNTANAQ